MNSYQFRSSPALKKKKSSIADLYLQYKQSVMSMVWHKMFFLLWCWQPLFFPYWQSTSGYFTLHSISPKGRQIFLWRLPSHNVSWVQTVSTVLITWLLILYYSAQHLFYEEVWPHLLPSFPPYKLNLTLHKASPLISYCFGSPTVS